ncbi:NADH-quinone oxidoreductase subunit C [Paramuribaculum intestinale]|jgi:NADH-quinone oxidoreductase subunit C/D|uniref:NADH-quinone oxidoreductase subunit D-related protein n=1 Tax=Paramuribaculum intestinale TaxID=2094151 RepID=UPI000D1F679D|nr:NADH-quinone oxidoreductase subunit C [Paramuribaculum intestinale]MBJ2186215.1 NADH-quinone oxidoreductase subunit D [Muribaculaceae bacterium]ROS91430.1 NADH-quinone oxidoreductase subunit D [Muribaculaceae bacterium Isolate-043 (Harlan)]ROT13270.1 NADH-quinone oxidoreductase subunit D [Muribaculaceae bacterium Isolate-105 (HZI)]MCX4330049.1 NADH-quinone oxidoreductase subunit C [Paramuribaculum intestinale]PWB12961.1 NADH-quinone oxidoreductase subunit D [Paramuribaculum intestinale]
MADIQERIAGQFPEATFDTSDVLTVEIPDAKLHALARFLRDELHFDYLMTIVGMDWVEKMGCIYYLQSTADHNRIAIKATTADRENPMLHSIADLWQIAVIYEREVFDFFGIVFIGNPDMRRLFLSIDWKGYPLRKDYDPSLNPVPTENERQSDFTNTYVEQADGKIVKEQARVFEEDDFVVNIGPQHPATHGVLRFRTAVDGETIKKIDVYMGYIHRGIEKICEGLTYPQTLHFMDRMDYFSAHNYHHGLCMTIEQAAGIEVSRRVQVIRVIMDELSRIASHCLFIGTFCMDLGATTMLFYTLRVREQILDIMDKTCGARMTFNYDTIGGVMQDLHPDFVKDVKALLAVLPANLKEYDKLFTGNVITRNRMEGVGYMSREDAVTWSVTGPSGRASGWACDIRKTNPYSIYQELDFEQVVMHEGDAMARFKVRMKEIEESAKIIAQLIDNIPDGEIQAKVSKVFKLPAGHWFRTVEGCRGAFGVYLESDGTVNPYRIKLVPPCLPAAAAVDHLTRGQKIADLITIGGSLDYIVPDIDR